MAAASALQELLDFVAGETGRRDVTPLPLSLVRLLGSAGGGLFVAQLLLWTEREADGEGWVARSAAEWRAATMLTPGELRAVVSRCRELGFLEVRAAAPGQGARRYRLLLAPLLRALLALLRGEAPVEVKRRRGAARRTVRLPERGRANGEWRIANGKWQGANGEWQRAKGKWEGVNGRTQGAGYGVPQAICNLQFASRLSERLNGHGGNGHGGNGNGEAAFNGACWEAALGEMRRQLPARHYERWLAGSRFAGVEGHTVLVEVESVNAAWWLNTRLSRPVTRAVNLVGRGKGWLAVVAVSR